jgi:hypothetical protein
MKKTKKSAKRTNNPTKRIKNHTGGLANASIPKKKSIQGGQRVQFVR